LLVALLLAVGPVAAKGPPAKVGITGPGIEGELRVTDPALLDALSFYGFNDLARRIDAPTVTPGTGYRIYRYADGESAWDSLTYYPDPEGGLGYLYFDGLNPAVGSTEGQGEWYLPSEAGAAAMRQILVENSLLPATGTARTTSPVRAAWPAAVALMIGLVLGGVLLLRRAGRPATLPTTS
jgi:hypothetical protein